MAVTYLVQFPVNMKNEKRLKILNEFQAHSWETFENLDASQITYTSFEAFWPHNSEPYFPEIAKACTITKK